MSSDLKKIRNTTSVRQSVVHNGTRIVLEPFGEQLVNADVATKFTQQLPGMVEDATNEDSTIYRGPSKPETMWIANMTGNPDCEAQVTVTGWKNKRPEAVEVEHPLLQARTLRWPQEGPQVEYIAKDGVPEAKNMGVTWIVIPPYKRVELPRHLGMWVLNQANVEAAVSRGARRYPVALESRPPSPYEPNMNMSLDEMAIYFELMDPNSTRPPLEKELRTKAKKQRWSDPKLELELSQARDLAWKRLFFRLIDNTKIVPSPAEFQAYFQKVVKYEAKKEAEKESAQVSA
jgi:hypothetical protein